MFAHTWNTVRLRAIPTVRLYSDVQVYRRLMDKSHRSNYASLMKEASRRHTNTSVLELRPTITHFLAWLHHKKKKKLDFVVLRKDGLPTKYKESTVLEMLVFHLLTCLHSDPSDRDWLDKQHEHLRYLEGVFSKRSSGGKKACYSVGQRHFNNSHDNLRSFAKQFISSPEAAAQASHDLSEIQFAVIEQTMLCISLACPSVEDVFELLPWLRSLSAPTVSQACLELSKLSKIPSFVTSDILLRTPMESNEFQLQLDLWNMFMADIAVSYHSKTLLSPVSNIIRSLATHAIIWNCSVLPELVENALMYFTSSRSGYKFNIFHTDFCNELIFLVAFAFIRNGGHNQSLASITKVQATLANYLTSKNLSQNGYLGIVLTIHNESPEKAEKLFQKALSNFPSYTSNCALVKIYLSATIEELMHHFNAGINQFPNSGNLWLVLIKKLIYFELLTDKRSQRLLADLVALSRNLIISRETILDLLLPVNTIHGMETFIETLRQARMYYQFRNTVLTKYMSILYKHSDQPHMNKPYLDRLFHNRSNLECARGIYHSIQWKTPTGVGIMLNGEVNHQPEKLFELYCRETKLTAVSEASLNALLRASLKSPFGKPLMWGDLYASQIAVHEFKLNVAKTLASSKEPGLLLPSDKLWKSYIRCLKQAGYTSELADIIRWWEVLHFQPKKSTLLLLLRSLPREFVERHVKHARAVNTGSELLLAWPWPSSGEI